MKKIIILLSFFLLSIQAMAKLRVVATTPDIAWLVKSLGRDKVIVSSLLDGSEDPHFVDAMPHWISKASRADIFCMVGLELEVGWAPRILSRSGNSKIQSGGKGHCNVGEFISALEIPRGRIDRSMGDVHGAGNPHYHLGPTSFQEAAKGIFEILVNNDPAHLNFYNKNLQKVLSQIKAIKKKAAKILSKVKDKKIMSYHREFSYFIKDFGLSYRGDIEELPGVPPSAGRIARVALEAKKGKVDLVLASRNNPIKVLDRFKEISGVSYTIVPISIQKSGQPSNYAKLILSIARRIAREKNH